MAMLKQAQQKQPPAPRAMGQHAVYTAKQLNDYKSGQRKSDGNERMMRMITERLTNKEIQEVSAYIQGLR